jgi:hypothetical protein
MARWWSWRIKQGSATTGLCSPGIEAILGRAQLTGFAYAPFTVRFHIERDRLAVELSSYAPPSSLYASAAGPTSPAPSTSESP